MFPQLNHFVVFLKNSTLAFYKSESPGFFIFDRYQRLRPDSKSGALMLPGLAVRNSAENNEVGISQKPEFLINYKLGNCTVICSGCQAFHWEEEKTNLQRTRQLNLFTNCCQKGTVIIPSTNDSSCLFPPFLERLMSGDTERKPYGFLALITFVDLDISENDNYCP